MDKLAPSPAHPAAPAASPELAPAEEPADPPAPAHDIDDDIRNHLLVDVDEVPMNDTQELARLGG